MTSSIEYGSTSSLTAIASRMPCEHDSAAPRKLRCQPSSIWWRFFTWMTQPPQSVMQYGITTFCTMPGCSRLHSS